MKVLRLVIVCMMLVTTSLAIAQDEEPKRTLFTNVNVFDGFADELAMNTDVLIEGNHIIEVGQNILRARSYRDRRWWSYLDTRSD